jgi:molybdenum-dependent DNA-binding transcriptional regulator ModE
MIPRVSGAATKPVVEQQAGVRKALNDRQSALTDLIHAIIREYRKAGEQPLTLRGSDYAHAVQELNKAIDRAEAFLQ